MRRFLFYDMGMSRFGCLWFAGIALFHLFRYSGNTGFSSKPHLRFAVFKARDGRTRQTIPIPFRTGEEPAQLREGKSYRAP